MAVRLDATPAQVALASLLDLGSNILPIPGTRARAHLTENLDAAGVRLDDAAHAELTRHFPPLRQEVSPWISIGRSPPPRPPTGSRFDALNGYVATVHFNGQSTVGLDGDRATGESYCLANHLTEAVS